MRHVLFSVSLAMASLAVAPLSIQTAGTALAQPAAAQPLTGQQPLAQPDSQDNAVQTPLRSPDLPEGSKPSDYLRAAAGALAVGQLGEAEEALEMAQTRMLDRSVPLFQTNNPINSPVIQQINQARQALAAHDRETCMRYIEDALTSATKQGL